MHLCMSIDSKVASQETVGRGIKRGRDTTFPISLWCDGEIEYRGRFKARRMDTVRLNRRRCSGPGNARDSRGLLSSCRPYQSYCTARLGVKHVFVCVSGTELRGAKCETKKDRSSISIFARYKRNFWKITYATIAFSLSFSSGWAGVRARHRCTNYVISLVRDSGNFST